MSILRDAVFSHQNAFESLTFLHFLLTLPLGQTVYCRYEPAKESALDWNVRRHDQALTQSPAALRRAGNPSAIPRRPSVWLSLLRRGPAFPCAHDPELA